MRRIYEAVRGYLAVSIVVNSAAIAASAGAAAFVLAKSEEYPVSDFYKTAGYKIEDYKFDATAYRVYKKDQYVGMLVGSMHANLNPVELEGFRNFFRRETQNSQKVVFTEIPLNSQLGGVEGALYSSLLDNQSVTQLSLGTLAANMFISVFSSIEFRDKYYLLPFSYRDIENNAVVADIGLKLFSYAVLVAKLCGVHSNINNDLCSIKVKEYALSEFKQYTSGTPLIGTPYTDRSLFIKERDAIYTKRLLDEMMVEENQGKEWLTTVGARHIAGPDSMSGILRNEGYILEPFNVYAEAIKLADTDQGSTILK
jgi:hypothetical protein